MYAHAYSMMYIYIYIYIDCLHIYIERERESSTLLRTLLVWSRQAGGYLEPLHPPRGRQKKRRRLSAPLGGPGAGVQA